MKKFGWSFQKFKECCSLCAAEQHMAASGQCFVWLLTPERCREGGCECVRRFEAGGQPNNNKGPALSLSPVIFQLSEKLLWHWKKVKLKSLAWYVLTTACRMCNTSKYFFRAVTVAVFGRATVPVSAATGQVTAPMCRSVKSVGMCQEAWLTQNVNLYQYMKE